MNWSDLETLLAVARSGSLGRASPSLGVDRTTVSRRIANLEKTLGVALFTRARDGLVLTESGKQAVAQVERMAEAAQAVERAAAPDQTVSGLVRIATTDSMAAMLIEGGLLDIIERYPTLQLEVLGGNQRLSLEEDQADIAVRVGPITGASLRVRCLMRMPLGLFAAPSYLRAHGTPLGVNDLGGHAVLLPSGELSRLPEARLLAAAKKVSVALRSNSLLALVAAAKQGRGLVPLTLPWGEREAGLERVLVLNRLTPRALWLVTTKTAANRPAVAAVAAHLANRFH